MAGVCKESTFSFFFFFLHVRFYIANIDQSILHLIPLPIEFFSCLTMSKVYSYLWTAMDYIPSNYLIMQVDEAIETMYLAQGHKHIGTSRAQTHGLAPRSPALFHKTTRGLFGSCESFDVHKSTFG